MLINRLLIKNKCNKHFDRASVEEAKTAFSSNDIQTCENFEDIIMNKVDGHAPLKKKILRTNNAQCITKQQ